MRFPTILVAIGAVFFYTMALAQDGPLFSFTEKPGPHGVGLKVVEQYDESRTYRHLTDELGRPYMGNRSRPLQTFIWYPADVQPSAKRMTVGDYGQLWATETSFGKPNFSGRAQEWLAAMKPTLGSPMWAVRDARESSGRFPVVIYAPSFSNMAWENADLCEYLASHGYVVVASASIGVNTREMTPDVAGVNAQAQDISFLIGYAQALSNADVSEVAVAGFSWGGIANLFAASRDNRIDALLAFDGSLRYWSGLVDEAGIDPQGLSVPLIFFAQDDYSLEDSARHLPRNEGRNVLNAWQHGELITVRISGMTHAQFSSMYQRNERTWEDFPQQQKADYGRDHGVPAYAWVARYTLKFLNAYLKRDESARAFLVRKPMENGVPKHFMTVTYRPAEGVPLSFEGFRSEVGRRGFEHVADIHAGMRQQRQDFKLDEIAVNGWAQELLDSNHLKEAIALLELNAQLYPDSSKALANLGKAYEESGLRSSAIESYRRTLAKNPTYAGVKRKLERLEE